MCEWIGGSSPPKHLAAVVDTLRADPWISQVATSFRELYQDRQRAGYDHSASFDKQATQLLVAKARAADEECFRRWETDSFATFFGLVALKLNFQ